MKKSKKKESQMDEQQYTMMLAGVDKISKLLSARRLAR